MTDAERMIAYEALVDAWSGGHEERRAKTEQFIEVCLRDGWPVCAYCGLDLVYYDSLFNLDHLDPRLKGTPGDGVDNLVAACRDCNGLKRTLVPDALPGATRQQLLEAARTLVREKRAARTLRSRYDLLRALLEGNE